MRIKLKPDKQKKLIEQAKKELTWEQLAEKLNHSSAYIRNELKNERCFLSEKNYNLLCNLINKNFDDFIIEKLEDNWGKIKGGLNSEGSTINLPEIKFDEKLAEFVGAVLGDGHIGFYKKGKKIGVYHIRIAGDLIKDEDYHINYLRPLSKKIFNLNARDIKHKKQNERFLDITSKKLVEFFGTMGIKPGNKIVNQSTIPKWIFCDKKYLRACIRGLIDTDGSIARMSQRDFNLLRIHFTNHDKTLLEDTRKAFIMLGFNPSKITCNYKFYLSQQAEIERYIKEIGFSNKKHLDRLKKFKNSPV